MSNSSSQLGSLKLGRGLLATLGAFALALAARPASAHPATPKWRALELRAETEGAAAVRELYRQDIAMHLDSLERSGEGASLGEVLHDSLTVSWLYQYLGSWAYVEARELGSRSTSAPALPEEVQPRLLSWLAEVVERETRQLDRLSGAWRSADAVERTRLGVEHPPEDSLEVNRRYALRHAALLAKIAGDAGSLIRAFEIARGEIDGCLSVDEFMAHPHDLEVMLRIQRPRGDGRPLVLATRQQEEAVRELVTRFWQASIRRDVAALERLYLDPSRAVALTRRLGEVRLVSVDLGQARYELRHLDGDRWSVRVDNVKAVKLEDGRSRSTVGGKSFEISLRDDQARIVLVGGGQ